MRPATFEAYKLLHEGSLALSDAESYGLKVDVAYLQKALAETKKKIKDLGTELKENDIWKQWRRRYGAEAKLTSRLQLSKVLFEDLGYTSAGQTASGKRERTDEAALEQLDIPFVRKYLYCDGLAKLASTYLGGIVRETDAAGIVHPIFNLHLVETYRSSCDSPNFQNMPIRDPEAGKLIRRCFIPRPGHRLVEIDYGQAEVHAMCWYHKDPVMRKYLEDKTKDMHRDVAKMLFKIDEVPKPCRQVAKGPFVFAEFYGDYYPHCARNIWKQTEGLTTADGRPMREHLAAQGIKQPGACEGQPRAGTFEKRVQEVEEKFWGPSMFAEYAAWKRRWWKEYLQRGYFRLLTGFVAHGVYRRNEVINTPGQGTAFHCLLWSFIQLNRWVRQQRMKARLVGQIHDSIVADVPDSEVAEFVAGARRIMVDGLRQHWSWITTPLDIEAEVTPANGSWHDKKAYAM